MECILQTQEFMISLDLRSSKGFKDENPGDIIKKRLY